MDIRLFYTQKSLKDLQEILGYIAQDDPEAASQFGTGLLDHIEILTRFPRIGAPLGKRPRARKLVHSPVFVYYEFNETKREITILHLRHGARKRPRSEGRIRGR